MNTAWVLRLWCFAARAPLAQLQHQQQNEASCLQNVAACVEAAGLPELQSLHAWIMGTPQHAYLLDSMSGPSPRAETGSPLESTAFGLFRELGLAVLSSLLDSVILCKGDQARCGEGAAKLRQGVLAIREALESRMAAVVQNYKPEAGVRSAVIRTSRHLRSDIDGLLHDLASLTAKPGVAFTRASELVQVTGHRVHMFAHQLGMHSWVRHLAVPGRGAPMFIIEDEYGSWAEMVETLVSNVVRNGPSQVSLVEIGVRGDDSRRSILQAFPGLQYIGVVNDRKDGPHSDANAVASAEQAAASLQEFTERAKVYLSGPEAAAAAIPLRMLDIVLLNVAGTYDQMLRDLELWQARVKPGGLIAGRGLYDAAAPGVAQAVCKLRFSNDLHIGVGGTYWWYVEPEEEEG